MSTMKGEQTRQRLIDSTARLMRRNGLNGTGVLDVIADSGAPRGSLYYHFPNGKEELVTDAVAQVREVVKRWIETGTVEQFFSRYARGLEKNDCREGCVVAALAAEGAPHSERLRAASDQAFRAWEDAFARKLEAIGHPRKQARGLATTILCVFEGALVLSRARGNADPLRDAYRSLKPIIGAA
jgi:TetR/AcrR family transcriptional regulator, lmrAB and yxaGH operons repressor